MPTSPRDAGSFSHWLRQTRKNLIEEKGADVDCDGCDGCCSSSYFIHVRKEEKATIAAIGRQRLVSAPGMVDTLALGHNAKGCCPMLSGGKCSIYENRAITCRMYDCRIFAACGIAAGDEDKERINTRVAQWQFSYPTERDRTEHTAVSTGTHFIRDHAHCFPGGNVPTNPSQLAILALKVYEVFIEDVSGKSDQQIADAIVAASRNFAG